MSDVVIIGGGQVATLLLLQQWYQNPFTPLLTSGVFVAVGGINGLYKSNISHVGVGAAKQGLMAVVLSGVAIFLAGESARLILFSSGVGKIMNNVHNPKVPSFSHLILYKISRPTFVFLINRQRHGDSDAIEHLKLQ